MSYYYEEIEKAVIDGNSENAAKYCLKSLQEGAAFQEIMNQGLIKGMSIIGKMFKDEEIFIPEVMVSARAMHSGINAVKANLDPSETISSKGTIVIGTVSDDMHDIGKNLVAMMLEGAGFKVVDLGINVSSEKFIQAVKQHKPVIVAVSALLTTTMVNMEIAISKLKEAYGDDIKVIVGGAPVTEHFADQIGADGFGNDASEAVEVALRLIGE